MDLSKKEYSCPGIISVGDLEVIISTAFEREQPIRKLLSSSGRNFRRQRQWSRDVTFLYDQSECGP